MEKILRDAFVQIKREDFLPKEVKGFAGVDEALPIGHDQTISQPFTVGFMLEKLQPKPGHKILDIGSGSGWTTALLAYIVGEQGKVVAIEVVPELKAFGERNVSKYNFVQKGTAQFLCADGAKGYAKEAPYNGILVSASLPSKNLPQAWKDQLAMGGTIVVPIQESLWTFTKKGENAFEEHEYPGFVFVPFA